MADIDISSSNAERISGFEEYRKRKMEMWRLLLHDLDDGRIEAEEIPVHALLYWWVGSGGDNKQKLVRLIQENPDAAKTAEEIQKFAQECLTQEHGGGDSVNLSIGPKIRTFRGIQDVAPTEGVIIKPWDSLTTNRDFASSSANPYADLGWKTGTLLEMDIPVENFFTYYKSHPAFNSRSPEEEYILNERGLDGAFIISIDGRTPTVDEAGILKNNMPGVEVVIEAVEVAKLI